LLSGQAAVFGMRPPLSDGRPPGLMPAAETQIAEEMVQAIREVPGVSTVYAMAVGGARVEGRAGFAAPVGGCDTFRLIAQIDRCADGEVFFIGRSARDYPGRLVSVRNSSSRGHDVEVGTWQLPDSVREVRLRTGVNEYYHGDVLATHGAVGGIRLPRASGAVVLDPGRPEAVERVRNVVAGFEPRASAMTMGWEPNRADDQTTFRTIRDGLLIGALFALLLAGVSLVVVALEQMRERRRALAALTAAGVR
jgi:hypothetical protein